MTTAQQAEITITLRTPHGRQEPFISSTAKRKVIRAGRRGGKTTGAAILAIQKFIEGRRVLYAAPTAEQTDKFWFEITRALDPAVKAGVYKLDQSERSITRPGSEQRIRAKTAWNANTLRGDFADLLILEEFQLMAEDTWDEVGAPMLLDNDGDAVFIYTPPSLRSSGISKARDPRHASKMFKRAEVDTTGRWAVFHFTSLENPYLSQAALVEITQDITQEAYRHEILAQDEDVEQGWLVYGIFKEAESKIQPIVIPRNWPCYSGHDFGSANPAALFLAQNPGPDEPRTSTGGQIRRGDLVAFKEYFPGPGFSTYQHVANFKDIMFGRKVVRSVGGNRTGEDEIRQGYTAHGWPILAPKIERPKAQIDRALGLIRLSQLHVFEGLFHFLTELANCMWVLDENNQPTDKIDNEAHYHMLACWRYIGSDFTPETIASSNETQVWRV